MHYLPGLPEVSPWIFRSLFPSFVRLTNHHGQLALLSLRRNLGSVIFYPRYPRNLRDACHLSFPPSPMTLTAGVEVVPSPSHSATIPQAGSSAEPPTRPSFESKRAYQPDVISLERISIEAPTPTQSEPPIVANAYSLNIRKLNIKFAAICGILFLEGWNLGATGPLIPAIQKYYNVSLRSSIRKVFLTVELGTGKLRSRLDDIPAPMRCESRFTVNTDRYMYTDERINGTRVSFAVRC